MFAHGELVVERALESSSFKKRILDPNNVHLAAGMPCQGYGGTASIFRFGPGLMIAPGGRGLG